MYHYPIHNPYFMYRATTETENLKAGQGFAAFHPQKGLFLGVDKDKKAVFKPISDLDPAQPVPVSFYAPDIISASSGDTAMLECVVYKVPVTDPGNRYTRADAAADLTSGRMNGSVARQAETKTAFNRAAFAVERFVALNPTRAYVAPKGPSPS